MATVPDDPNPREWREVIDGREAVVRRLGPAEAAESPWEPEIIAHALAHPEKYPTVAIRRHTWDGRRTT